MAVTVSAVTVEVKITATQTTADGVRQNVIVDKSVTFTGGTGSGKVGDFWYDASRNVNATTEDLDFGTGGLSGLDGSAMVLPGINVIYQENLDADSGDTIFFKDSSTADAGIITGTNPKLKINPSGFFLLVDPGDGYTLADGSADHLGIEATDNSNMKLLVAG